MTTTSSIINAVNALHYARTLFFFFFLSFIPLRYPLIFHFFHFRPHYARPPIFRNSIVTIRFIDGWKLLTLMHLICFIKLVATIFYLFIYLFIFGVHINWEVLGFVKSRDFGMFQLNPSVLLTRNCELNGIRSILIHHFSFISPCYKEPWVI